MITLKGKVAIVTGAAHGIGRAITEVFADAGARVIGADIDDSAWSTIPKNAAGGEARLIRADAAVADDVQRIVREAAAVDDRIDVLCNNAAYLGRGRAAGEATDEEWEQCFRISLMGSQRFCCKCDMS